MRFCGLLLAVVVGLLPMGAKAEAPIVIKFSHVVAADTPKGKAAEMFAAKAAELTQGRVKVVVYPNSTLYRDRDEMAALQLGAVQMLAPSLAKFEPLGIRKFEVFDLPFIFSDYESLHKVTDGPLGRQLLAELEDKGIRGLAYWDNGFKSFSANAPIRGPGDLKGLKMRIQPSRVIEEQMRALGALPQVMSFSDVYQALKTGVVDGTENPMSNLYTQRMHEVQKHLALTRHGYLGYAVIVNKKFWDELPGDVRRQLNEAMAQATRYENQIARAENDAALEAIRQSGRTVIYVPAPAERLLFKKALLPVHRKMEARIGKDVIDAVYAETGFRSDGL